MERSRRKKYVVDKELQCRLLAIIDSILHQHKAMISLDSEAGKGTTFVISFPRGPS